MTHPSRLSRLGAEPLGEVTEPERLAAKPHERKISLGNSEALAEEQCNLVHARALSAHVLIELSS